MNPEAMYHALCAQPDLTAAARGLNEFELSRLIRWLRSGHCRGLQGLVLGMAELEAAERFVKAHPTE
jgi:hypothetical protein